MTILSLKLNWFLIHCISNFSRHTVLIIYILGLGFVCLFVCLFGVFRPTREFFTQLEMSPLPVKGCKFWPMLGTHGHWAVRGLYSVSHLLWHGASVYNGHLRGPVTVTPNAERLAVELSLPVLTTWFCRGWDSNTQPSACRANALTHCATAAARFWSWDQIKQYIDSKWPHNMTCSSEADTNYFFKIVEAQEIISKIKQKKTP